MGSSPSRRAIAVGIAQLVRVPGCGPGGRGFEPHYSPHFFLLFNAGTLGCRQAARHGTLTPAFARFESCHPSYFDPLAQLAEHLTFNQGAWGSNPQWVTILLGLRVWRNGRRGRFRICCLGRMSSSLFTRTILCGSSSVVDCHLAKVDVASPNLVYRSTVRV